MAKSKEQKREEALKRQRDGFLKYTLRDLTRVGNTSNEYYDAETHRIVYDQAVRSAHAAHCDLHGNYLPEIYYCRAGLYDFVSSNDPEVLALHNKLYSLEEMKEIKSHNGRTLYKIAYGTPPFVPEVTKHYDVSYSPTIKDTIKAGVLLGIDPAIPDESTMMYRTPAMVNLSDTISLANIASLAAASSLSDQGLCKPLMAGISDSVKREALHQQLSADLRAGLDDGVLHSDNIPVISSIIDGGLRRGEIFVIGAGSPPLSNYRGPFAHKAPFIVTVPSEPAEDPNRADIIMETVSTFGNQEVFDYLAGRISYQECISIVGQRAQKTDPNWNPEIDGAALLAFHQKRMSSETYLKIRNRKENGLSDAECLDLISVAG